MPHSYLEQSKRLWTCLAKNGHVQINDKEDEFIIKGKSYNFIDFISDLIANCTTLGSLDHPLYKLLKSSKFQNKSYWE